MVLLLGRSELLSAAQLFLDGACLGLVIERGERIALDKVVNALLGDGVAALQWLHHGVFTVDELMIVEDLRQVALLELRIDPGDAFTVLGCDLVALVAQGFAQLVRDSGGVDELHLAATLLVLVLGQDPDVGGDAGVVEQVSRQRDDGFDQVIFEQPTTDLALPGSSTSIEQGATVLDNGGASHLRIHLVYRRLQEEHLGVTTSGQTGTKTPCHTLGMFGLDGLLDSLGGILAAPSSAEGRVLDDEPHLAVREAISLERVLIADIVGILSLDQHFRQADGVGLRVDLLAKKAHVGRGVQALDVALGGGQHAAGTARLVQNRHDLGIIEQILAALCEQEVHHEFDDVTARVMVTCLRVLGEPADEVLEDIAHMHVVDGLRVKIEFREGLDHGEQAVVLVHLVDLVAELEALVRHDDLLDIGGEAIDVVLEIGRQVRCIIQQLGQSEPAGVVELESCLAFEYLGRQ